jgi:ActD protein
MKPPELHGLMVECQTADEIVFATRNARMAGYRHMDAYTPYAVAGLAEELGMRRTVIPTLVLLAGLCGAAVGFGMQYFSMAIDYQLNAGGRPYNSWPVFIPITFELLVLVGSFAAVLGMFFLNGLPRPYHPVFNVPEFGRASQDRFFLCIEATDPQFDRTATAAFLSSLQPPSKVFEVPQ